MKVKQIKEFVKTKLEEAMELLPQELRLGVEIPSSISNYALIHPLGVLLVFYEGSDYTRKEVQYYIAQNRDVRIQVAVIVRYRNEMTPEEYLDYVIQALSGIEINTQRSDRKIYCPKDEFVSEENGIWTYIATMIIPEEFFETELLEQLEGN